MAIEHPQNITVYDLFENNEEIILSSLKVHFPFADAYADIEFDDVDER